MLSKKTFWAYGPGIAVDLEKCMCLPLPNKTECLYTKHFFLETRMKIEIMDQKFATGVIVCYLLGVVNTQGTRTEFETKTFEEFNKVYKLITKLEDENKFLNENITELQEKVDKLTSQGEETIELLEDLNYKSQIAESNINSIDQFNWCPVSWSNVSIINGKCYGFLVAGGKSFAKAQSKCEEGFFKSNLTTKIWEPKTIENHNLVLESSQKQAVFGNSTIPIWVGIKLDMVIRVAKKGNYWTYLLSEREPISDFQISF